jgi:hypothetical protein
VAETIRVAAGNGLVGCTIEDATGNPDAPLCGFRVAVERIAHEARWPKISGGQLPSPTDPLHPAALYHPVVAGNDCKFRPVGH